MDGRRNRAAVTADRVAARSRLQQALAAADRADARFAAVRLAIAGVALAVGLGGYATTSWSPAWLGAPLLLFAGVAVAHARHAAAQTGARRRLAVVERSIARLEDRWQGLGPSGLEHLPADHPYAEDLDIVGRGSLFDLVCTARTQMGERTLAAWLLGHAEPGVVQQRQSAVAELANRETFRDDLAALGPDLPAAATTSAVAQWATAGEAPPPRWAPAILVALSAATIGGLGVWTWTGEPPAWMGGAAAAHATVGWWMRPRVRAAIRAVDARARDLAVAATLLERVEREACDSPLLVSLQARLSASGAPAAVEIHRLARLVELLSSRQNQLFGPVSVLLFWATHLAWAIDRWRARVGHHVPGWFETLGELEALAALGTFAAERPEAVYPLVDAGPPRILGRAVAHPLLPPSTAIGNDVALGGDAPHLVIISGSNMSGKSTYLRAIGANVVLALAGAPVCAEALTLTPLVPAGTLRVQDSLQSGRSRFFAEITKLRQIVDLARARGGAGTLFLIDELLSGTNSHDRQLGAAGVLRGLVDLGAIGYATTHDLALTALADEPGLAAANVHFADRFEDGGLTFDYRLRPGVVGASNALALMRSVGLDV